MGEATDPNAHIACYRYDVVLGRIAASPRPDGTYNLGREACEQIVREALDAQP